MHKFSQFELDILKAVPHLFRIIWGPWWVTIPIEQSPDLAHAFRNNSAGWGPDISLSPYKHYKRQEIYCYRVAIMLKVNDIEGYFLIEEHENIYEWLRTTVPRRS